MTHHARASSLSSSSSQSITALEASSAPMESTSNTSSFEFCNLFVYGTLMAPEIMESLLGRKLPGLFVSPTNNNDNNNNNNGDDHQLVQPARLWGYQRHPVLGECYPGLIAAVANSNSDNDNNNIDNNNNMLRTTPAFTDGLLYRNLVTIAERDSVLDDYEGADYTRTPVTVQLIESSKATPTTTTSADNDILSTSGAYNNSNDWIAAETYVWTNSVTQLDLTQSWSYEEFRKVHLPNYSLGQQIA